MIKCEDAGIRKIIDRVFGDCGEVEDIMVIVEDIPTSCIDEAGVLHLQSSNTALVCDVIYKLKEITVMISRKECNIHDIFSEWNDFLRFHKIVGCSGD